MPADRRYKLLILGGYGTFGARLARLIAADTRLELIIAGRSLEKAAALCTALPPGAARLPATADRNRNIETALAALGPDLVVDASGPFQAYGVDPYRVVKAALALGIDYVDLADSSDFVTGIGQFDAAVQARGTIVLSGASTCPALTAAAVRHLAKGLARVETVIGGVTPSPRATVGRSVIRAIASYAGRAIDLRRNGRTGAGHALIDAMNATIAPPGVLPLLPVRFSLVDVPDLRLLPELWPELRTVWFGAGPRPALLHRLLTVMAFLVRWRFMPSLAPFAAVFDTVHRWLCWGEHRGGMLVRVTGRRDDGAEIERSWHLLAEGDSGPSVPAMAVAALVGKFCSGDRPSAGARPATTDLELADFAPFFAATGIRTGTRERSPETAALPLYRRVLGAAYEALPEALRRMHEVTGEHRAVGRAIVERGFSPLARLIAALIGFPATGGDIPVAVSFRRRNGLEIWQRNFAGRVFTSEQWAGTGADDALIVERFGPFQLGLAPVVEDGRLRLVARSWRCFGIPLPRRLAPGGEIYEAEIGGRFNFHVEIGHPLTGLIVRYRGWLVPDPSSQPATAAGPPRPAAAR